MVKGIRHTGIVVSDMEKALYFYRDLLGLNKILCDSVVSSQAHSLVTGLTGARIHTVMLEAPDGSCLELLQYLSHPRPAPAGAESCDVGCSHVAFTVDNVDHLYSELSSKGVHFNGAPQVDQAGYAKFTYVHDFDGTIVELTEVVDQGKTPYGDSLGNSELRG